MSDTCYMAAFDAGVEPGLQRLGGKCVGLAKMTAAGLPVPPGFAVTTDAFDQVAAAGGLTAKIRGLLDGLDHDDTTAVHAVSGTIRAAILAQPMPDDVRSAFEQAYAGLMDRFGREVPVAVRSSATAEDIPDASFAGQQDTYLWVQGREGVIAKIHECWASLYTPRAITYRRACGISDDGLSMAVGVQKMVNAKSAGVAMTLDPGNGDRSKIVIDSCWGLGEPLVSGELTPDYFVLDKVMLTVVRRTVADKPRQLIVHEDGQRLVTREVPADRRCEPSLSDEELLAVARLAKTAERHYKIPLDIEWAIDRDLPGPGNVLLLQARPETVWSRRSATRTVTSAGAGIHSITKTLLNQVGQR